MSPILIWFIMVLLLLAGLWSSNYLLPLIRLIRTYWHSPLGLPHVPRILIFAFSFTLLSIDLNPPTLTHEATIHAELQESIRSIIAKQGNHYFQKMVDAELIHLDSKVHYQQIRPEIAYALASVLHTVYEISGINRLIVSSVNDRNHTRHSYHYRNLAIDLPMARLGVTPRQAVRVRKKLALRLGPGYRIIYGVEGHMRHMHIQYEGPAWNAEKIMALPILEAATQEHINPALLLAWAKVATGFDPHFNDQRGRSGILALQHHDIPVSNNQDTLDLNAYLRSGAKLLSTQLKLSKGDTALALASLNSSVGSQNLNASTWWKEPTVATWVDQILLESKNYQHKFAGSSWTESLAKPPSSAEES